ncbi:Hypothetical predicted protein [Cloeon dipterum]|uniref:DNA (cytosine-5-)-methyltransferase n=1 Tax=Cloeon dipterum TaxID=197152 RepID=A0A8S1DFF8_9INSE|nr:Hypothetical predicted protein [Cloeon dipterum]
MKILPDLPHIEFILLENVVGFEKSDARNQLTDVLKKIGFCIQEFHLCPSQFNIPNKRPRYYMLAKRGSDFKYNSAQSLQTQLPVDLIKEGGFLAEVHHKVIEKCDDPSSCFKIGKILEEDSAENSSLAEKDLKFFMEFDLVGRESRLSGCFTKSYKRYFLGTGSIFLENFDKLKEVDTSTANYQAIISETLKPRFFTSREILRLMCFPEWFTFPTEVSSKQAAAVLGNSINVHVVALLIGLLVM